MLYVDRLKLIKSMITAKEDDGIDCYIGGYNVGGVQIGNMNYGGINMGGVSLDNGEEHEFEREEIYKFIFEEIENLKIGRELGIGEKRARLQNTKRDKEETEIELVETAKYRIIKRAKIKKELVDKERKVERAQLLVDMRNVDIKHIRLLEQIGQILTEQKNGGNKYKRKEIKKYINYAIYRIEQQERGNLNEDELAQHSFFERLRVTGEKINAGHYGESAKSVMRDWTLENANDGARG